MALLGIRCPTGQEATSALHSAISTVDALALWNAKRVNAGRDLTDADAGANAKSSRAALCDIGTRESMSFTAIADTVNSGSRTQELCRSFRSPTCRKPNFGRSSL
jgi:hypothetical protein